MKKRINPLVWTLLWPVRAYIKYFPCQRAKGFLTRNFLKPILPPSPETFSLSLPGGTRIDLRYREALGLSSLLHGVFEKAEIEFLCSKVQPGSVVMDIGANIGLFTVALARAVGDEGKVIAFEPLPENVERLQYNIEKNALRNVEIHSIALGDHDGETEIYFSDDGAYASIFEIKEGRAVGNSQKVKVVKLDHAWREGGSRPVAAMKIDVEGAEISVLNGGIELLKTCHPLILIEANTDESLLELIEFLQPLKYHLFKPKEFKDWNYFFF